MQLLPLETSEHTHAIRPLLAVGSCVLAGPDQPAKGALTIFDIIPVVPEPDRPETGIQLHVLSREETKGAVTALAGFGGGFVGTAQGMKLMVRGLKEDGQCLPVAFLDAQCSATVLKTLGSTGLWLAGDIWKGVWFGGWTEEPFKLTLLGKSRSRMEVVAAEFLPTVQGELYLMVVDGEARLNVLQFDPENPKSGSAGARLLERGSFMLGSLPTGMLLLPSTLKPIESAGLTNGHAAEQEQQVFHVLIPALDGSLSLLTPLSESSYRRVSALQAQLTSSLEHAAGLNPRAFRDVQSEGGRGVVDGGVVQRLGELGFARRGEVLGRAGAGRGDTDAEVEVMGGAGLGYL